jgi:hypothetical protein
VIAAKVLGLMLLLLMLMVLGYYYYYSFYESGPLFSLNLFTHSLQSSSEIFPCFPTFTLISVVAFAEQPYASHMSLLVSDDNIS